MNSLKRDISVLMHMKNYCKEVEETIKRYGNDFNVFIQDKDYKKSISMSILQIGELVTHLTYGYVEETISKINWRQIKGMRNLFAHQYLKMEDSEIYKTALEDIPKLKELVEIEINRLLDIQEKYKSEKETLDMGLKDPDEVEDEDEEEDEL